MKTFHPTTRHPNYAVLPQIQIAQDSSGVVLQELRGQYWSLLFHGFSTLFFLIAMSVFLVLFRSWAGFGGINVDILLLVVVLALLFMFLRKLMIMLCFGPGKLILSKWPLHLGGKTEVRFVRNIRGRATIERLEARLVCTEVVSYKARRKTRTAREVVWEQELPITMNMTSDSIIEATSNICIPLDSPPSLSVRRNQIVWSVEVKAYVANFPDTTSSFTLVVRPEVV